jgi:hypothetical protein
LHGVAERCWIASSARSGRRETGRYERFMAKARSTAKKVSCDSCYFKCNMLCALKVDEPCVTYRPDSPEGLRPPRQMHFTFRDESIRRTAFAFPSAQEQAALHA